MSPKMNYTEKLNAVIPGGAHTYSRGFDQYPENAPQILKKGKGSDIWDDKDRKFLDYGMALRAVTLGYANDRVNQAAYREMENGVNLTRPSMIELEAAELMVDLIDSAEMVKFAKNGSNVTTAALKVARAYTGRKYICIPRQHPFFSFDDWFIGKTPITSGIPEEYHKYTLLFDYNDISSLDKLFDEYHEQIAAVMLEPATTLTPCQAGCENIQSVDKMCVDCPDNKTNFLHLVKALCHRKGALFILDEMITGFRWHLKGAQYYFGVEPDLSTFGKGMANGFSVAALTGKKEFMKVGSIDSIGSERTFLISTTHGAEMPGLGALVETVKVYQEENAINHFWDYGEKLRTGFRNIIRSIGLENNFIIDGNPISMNFLTKDNAGNLSLEYRTLFLQEMINNGVLMPWIAISLAHNEESLSTTFIAIENSLKVYKLALENGLDKYLKGRPVKPVFRKFN